MAEDGLRDSLVDSLKLNRSRRNVVVTYGTAAPAQTTPESSMEKENPNFYTLDNFDQFPVYATCPHCSKRVLTHIEYKAGSITWLLAGFCFLLGCWCGCCALPFVWKECKDVRHICPDCGFKMALYKRGQQN